MCLRTTDCIYREPVNSTGSGYLYYYFKSIHLRVLLPWSISVCLFVHSPVYACLFPVGLHSIKQQIFLTVLVSVTLHTSSHLTVTNCLSPQVHHPAAAVQPDGQGGARLRGAAGRDALGLQWARDLQRWQHALAAAAGHGWADAPRPHAPAGEAPRALTLHVRVLPLVCREGRRRGARLCAIHSLASSCLDPGSSAVQS